MRSEWDREQEAQIQFKAELNTLKEGQQEAYIAQKADHDALKAQFDALKEQLEAIAAWKETQDD